MTPADFTEIFHDCSRFFYVYTSIRYSEILWRLFKASADTWGRRNGGKQSLKPVLEDLKRVLENFNESWENLKSYDCVLNTPEPVWKSPKELLAGLKESKEFLAGPKEPWKVSNESWTVFVNFKKFGRILLRIHLFQTSMEGFLLIFIQFWRTVKKVSNESWTVSGVRRALRVLTKSGRV